MGLGLICARNLFAIYVRGCDVLNLGVLLSGSHSRTSPDEHRMEHKTFNRRLA